MSLRLGLLLGLQLGFVRAGSRGPLTEHFTSWLNSNGYEKFDFPRLDMDDHGSFGGRQSDNEKIAAEPVVFIHGNSDAALKANDFSTGWTNTVEYFLANNYTLAELYATSWGNTNTTQAILRDHDCHTILRLRKFVEAVLGYTNAKKINLITHSMGVTLGRKVIQGGFIEANDGTCDVGKPLTAFVDVFLGISGANYGLCTCVGGGSGVVWPTCNLQNGLWPGDQCGPNNGEMCGVMPLPVVCNDLSYSRFLMDLNSIRAARDGESVFSMWSRDDDLIGSHDAVWGRNTSEVPNSKGNVIYTGKTHMQTKEDSAADQYHIITLRSVP